MKSARYRIRDCRGLFTMLAVLWLTVNPAAMAAESGLFRTLAPDTADLTQYRWHKRPLVIFAPSENDANYQQQIAILKQNASRLSERDIVVLTDTAPDKLGQLRSQLKPKGFEVVLVGKDGGMKLRETTPIAADALLTTIDQMPMRKAKLD